jgi:hypothetical protein
MLTIVSASNMTLSQTTIYLSKAVNSSNIALTNIGSNPMTVNFPSSVTITNAGNTDSMTFAISAVSTTIPAGNSTTVTVHLTSGPSNWVNFKTGVLYTNSVLFQSGTENAVLNLNVINDFCKVGVNGTYLSISSVEDNTKDNEDEWIWHPLDVVKITVNEVYNGFAKDKSITVEYALYDDNGKKVDFGEIDTFSTVSIKSENDKDVSFEFQIPADVNNGNYKLFVKAFVKGSESNGCTSVIGATTPYYQAISIDQEDTRAVVFDKNELNAVEATCGETVNMDLTAYNIGTEDEDKVLVNLYNKELGLDLYQVITDLGTGNSDTTSFSFDIPSDATEKTYYFDLETFYNYDDSNSGCNKETDLDCYDENSLDDLDKTFTTAVIVKGNCIGSVKNEDVSITAQLVTAEDEVKAGNEIQIKATYTNTGNKTVSYIAGLSGYENWSSIVDITPQSFTLVKGESKVVLMTLKVDKGISGEQIFKVRALYDGNVKEKLVSLSVAKASGFNLPAIFTENKLLVWIVIVNVILVILIIIVAIKVARN